jgi:Fe-S-cluster containining protein
MVEVDCNSCQDKCCTYKGWKIFFTEDERRRVERLYGLNKAALIDQFQSRRGTDPVYAITLPCPFFSEKDGKCGVYDARPLICRIFPVEIEVITGSIYMDRKVCPERDNAKVNFNLVQIEVQSWYEKFWGTESREQEVLDRTPVCDDCP